LSLDLAAANALVECRSAEAQHACGFSDLEAERLKVCDRLMHGRLWHFSSPQLPIAIRLTRSSITGQQVVVSVRPTDCALVRSIPPFLEAPRRSLRELAQIAASKCGAQVQRRNFSGEGRSSQTRLGSTQASVTGLRFDCQRAASFGGNFKPCSLRIPLTH
jgi:hypothetical protein